MNDSTPMNANDIESLRRRMGEVAALPPDDPQRLAVLADVAAAGAWAEREWVELQQFDEHTRVALRRVEVPAGLSDRLAAIPSEAPPRRLRLPRLRPLLAVAAALLIAASVWTAWPSPAYTAEQIAELAVAHHLKGYPTQVETTDIKQIETKFANSVSWDVIVPPMGEGMALLGGRVCRLAGNTIICTTWQKDGVRYSLYQFCPTDFNLSKADLAAHFRVPDSTGQFDVDVWTNKHGCGYAKVREPV